MEGHGTNNVVKKKTAYLSLMIKFAVCKGRFAKYVVGAEQVYVVTSNRRISAEFSVFDWTECGT
jgi:hypothetical protein